MLYNDSWLDLIEFALVFIFSGIIILGGKND